MSQDFAFALRDLSNSRVKLELFEQLCAEHVALIDRIVLHPELHRYLPWPAWTQRSHFYTWYSARISSTPTTALFAVFTRASSGQYEPAGLVGLLNASAENELAEVGFLLILPEWQQTHVLTNAVGTLIKYCMDTLKLRRLQWQAHADNSPSIRAAHRLGFKLEGIMRWQRALPLGKEGLTRGEDTKPGRHTAMLALCWDDWELGNTQTELQAQMERVA
ncbi:acyl-CoA N-acyltransferase [Auricularia subglabra TFB-10046 SS5]|nr:acyl-CoA N-acyltransferase [Auricularia subglabra TFB-10046 SS5]